MEIVSKMGKKVIPITIYKYDSFMKRFKGLMFRIRPIKEEGILLIPCNSIHMFFMFISIDVIFIDKNHYIVKTISNLRPWRVVFPVKHANAAIELPKGTIKNYQIKQGDLLILD